LHNKKKKAVEEKLGAICRPVQKRETSRLRHPRVKRIKEVGVLLGIVAGLRMKNENKYTQSA